MKKRPDPDSARQPPPNLRETNKAQVAKDFRDLSLLRWSGSRARKEASQAVQARFAGKSRDEIREMPVAELNARGLKKLSDTVAPLDARDSSSLPWIGRRGQQVCHALGCSGHVLAGIDPELTRGRPPARQAGLSHLDRDADVPVVSRGKP